MLFGKPFLNGDYKMAQLIVNSPDCQVVPDLKIFISYNSPSIVSVMYLYEFKKIIEFYTWNSAYQIYFEQLSGS